MPTEPADQWHSVGYSDASSADGSAEDARYQADTAALRAIADRIAIFAMRLLHLHFWGDDDRRYETNPVAVSYEGARINPLWELVNAAMKAIDAGHHDMVVERVEVTMENGMRRHYTHLSVPLGPIAEAMHATMRSQALQATSWSETPYDGESPADMLAILIELTRSESNHYRQPLGFVKGMTRPCEGFRR